MNGLTGITMQMSVCDLNVDRVSELLMGTLRSDITMAFELAEEDTAGWQIIHSDGRMGSVLQYNWVKSACSELMRISTQG